jgi:hypothetical protein
VISKTQATLKRSRKGSVFRGDEGHYGPSCTRPGGPPGPVQVVLYVGWKVKVDDPGDVVDVDPSGCDVSGHQRVDFARPEVCERALALRLRAVSMDGRRGDAGVLQASSQPVCAVLGPHKNHRRARSQYEISAQCCSIRISDSPELVAGPGYFLRRGDFVPDRIALVPPYENVHIAIERG